MIGLTIDNWFVGSKDLRKLVYDRCDKSTLFSLSATCKAFRPEIVELIFPLKVITNTTFNKELKPELQEIAMRLLKMVYMTQPLINVIKVKGDPFFNKFSNVHVGIFEKNSKVRVGLGYFDESTRLNDKLMTHQKPFQEYLDRLTQNHGFPPMQGFCTNLGFADCFAVDITHPDETKLKQALKEKKTDAEIIEMLKQARDNGYKPSQEFLTEAIKSECTLELACWIAAIGGLGLTSAQLLKVKPALLCGRKIIHNSEEEFDCWWNREKASLCIKTPVSGEEVESVTKKHKTNKDASNLNDKKKRLVTECAPKHFFDLINPEEQKKSPSHIQMEKLMDQRKLKPTKKLMYYSMKMELETYAPGKWVSSCHFGETLDLIVSKGKIQLAREDLEQVLIGDYHMTVKIWMISKFVPTKEDLYLYLEHEQLYSWNVVELIFEKGGFTLTQEEMESILIKYQQARFQIIDSFMNMGFKVSRKYFLYHLEHPARHLEAWTMIYRYYHTKNDFKITQEDLTFMLQHKLIKTSDYQPSSGVYLLGQLIEKGELKPTFEHVLYAIVNGYPFEMVFCLLQKGGIKLTIDQLVQLMTKYQIEARRDLYKKEDLRHSIYHEPCIEVALN